MKNKGPTLGIPLEYFAVPGLGFHFSGLTLKI